jgi:hypothetical protein
MHFFLACKNMYSINNLPVNHQLIQVCNAGSLCPLLKQLHHETALFLQEAALQKPFLARRQALQSASQLERPLLLQATFEGFQRNGIDEKGAEKLMRLSVQLACEVRAGFRALYKLEFRLQMRWYKLLVFQGA